MTAYAEGVWSLCGGMAQIHNQNIKEIKKIKLEASHPYRFFPFACDAPSDSLARTSACLLRQVYFMFKVLFKVNRLTPFSLEPQSFYSNYDIKVITIRECIKMGHYEYKKDGSGKAVWVYDKLDYCPDCTKKSNCSIKAMEQICAHFEPISENLYKP